MERRNSLDRHSDPKSPLQFHHGVSQAAGGGCSTVLVVPGCAQGSPGRLLGWGSGHIPGQLESFLPENILDWPPCKHLQFLVMPFRWGRQHQPLYGGPWERHRACTLESPLLILATGIARPAWPVSFHRDVRYHVSQPGAGGAGRPLSPSMCEVDVG